MTILRPPEYYAGLVRELCKLPKETEWVEFKVNNSNPEEIGEYISGLANASALAGKANGYLAWGVEENDHAIVGTSFAPKQEKRGNEELESWLLQRLSPKISFLFVETEIGGKRIVVLEVERAFKHPVKYQNEEYIRVGSYKKKLKDFPEKERDLWRVLDQIPFEAGIAAEHLDGDEVLALLDAPAYFDLLEAPLPDGRAAILSALSEDRIVTPCEAGGWSITNLGAALFAKKLASFPSLKRKAVRVVVYEGKGRVKTQRE